METLRPSLIVCTIPAFRSSLRAFGNSIDVGNNVDWNEHRNSEQKQYSALVLDDGSLELLGQKFSSPSYAALAGIQDAGSDRQTVNGWTSWKTKEGKLIADLREKYINHQE